MTHIPRGAGAFGGTTGIVLVYVLTAYSYGEEDIGKMQAVLLMLIPILAGIVWNRSGRRLLSRLAKGDNELAGRLADTVETVFFIIVLMTLAVLYNMGLIIL